MAEGLAVVAIVSSVVQLVDFSSKVIARLNEFQSCADAIPKSLGFLKTELPLLVRTLQQIQGAVDQKLLANNCAAALLPTIQGCDGLIQEINKILAKTLPTQGDGRRKKAIKSVGSVWSEGKIENIQKTLRGYTSTLTFYFAASSSTFLPLTGKSSVITWA